MRVLLTGYGAFDVHKDNPSQHLAKAIEKKSSNDLEIVTKILPVVFSEIPDVLADLDLASYDIVLFTGLAGSREKITPEKVALNWIYSPERSDNSGVKIEEGRPLVPELPLAQMATFPVEELTKFLNEEGMEASLSFSAGTYVCNATFFYGLCYCLGQNKCAFLHIPKDCDVERLADCLSRFFIRMIY